MGTWDTSILGNDTSADVYARFYELYNEGGLPQVVSNLVKGEFRTELQDHEDKYNALFALTLAEWETRCLESESLSKVVEVVNSRSDLALWKELGGVEKQLEKRSNTLMKFLEKIAVPRPKAKRRLRPKFEFEVKVLQNIIAPDGLKDFQLSQEFVNKKYVHTSGLMDWKSGGGAGIAYINEEHSPISARWVDSQNLEITTRKNQTFTKKEVKTYYCGDEVYISYIEK